MVRTGHTDRSARRAPAHASWTPLRRAARGGAFTLVVGAGVSIPHGVPSWRALVDTLWRDAFASEPPHELETLPHFFPFALERIEQAVGERRFGALLRKALYGKTPTLHRAGLARSSDSLSVLARWIVSEIHAGPSRRLARVITFNADDLLEQAVSRLAPREWVVKVVSRASHHPAGIGPRSPIPFYHLHGLVPQDPRAHWYRTAHDALIFTDRQYWASVASPLSFANRTMAFALHDSHCLFVGTSMTDVNLLRWLATHALDVDEARRRELASAPARAAAKALVRDRTRLRRHFWVRPRAEGVDFFGECLSQRGVSTVWIPSWDGAHFRKLLESAFGAER
jgi:hypothetical protein